MKGLPAVLLKRTGKKHDEHKSLELFRCSLKIKVVSFILFFQSGQLNGIKG